MNKQFPTQIRWKQRFENFDKSFKWLDEPFKQKSLSEFSVLEQQGIIQRFEICYELAWKTMKDYLEHNGIVFEQTTPRYVIKQAFASGLVKNGQAWIDMMEIRNTLSHTYDETRFEQSLSVINNKYLSVIKELHGYLSGKLDE